MDRCRLSSLVLLLTLALSPLLAPTASAQTKPEGEVRAASP
jgi:hypothetical protein